MKININIGRTILMASTFLFVGFLFFSFPTSIYSANGCVGNQIKDANGNCVDPSTVSSRVAAPGTMKFKYRLLEQFPGFFQKGEVVSDLKTMISALYKFGVWTIGIAATLMLVIGGFMYMTSAGNTSKAGSAKGVITDALIGLVVALGSYLLFYVINPDLVKMNFNIVQVGIKEMTIEVEEDVDAIGVSGSQVMRNGYSIDSSFAESLNRIKANQGITTVVTSGLRTLERQRELIVQNCGGYPPTRACSPTTCLLKNGPTSCPHTTGLAMDVWATLPNGSQALSQKQCQANISACFNNSYQRRLIDALRAEGFCVLDSEPWHFEKPKMSAACKY